MEKHVLVKIMFPNGLNMGLPLWASVEETVVGEETHWLSGKEKVPDAEVSKDGDGDSPLWHERAHHNWFLWKRRKCKLPISNPFGNISPFLNDVRIF